MCPPSSYYTYAQVQYLPVLPVHLPRSLLSDDIVEGLWKLSIFELQSKLHGTVEILISVGRCGSVNSTFSINSVIMVTWQWPDLWYFSFVLGGEVGNGHVEAYFMHTLYCQSTLISAAVVCMTIPLWTFPNSHCQNETCRRSYYPNESWEHYLSMGDEWNWPERWSKSQTMIFCHA